MIDRVVTAYRQRRLFEEFVLCPEELEDLLKKLVAIDARDQMREWLRSDLKWQYCDLWEKPTLFGLLDRPDPETATLIMFTPNYAPLVLLERMDDQGYSIVADGQFDSECDSTSYTYKDGNVCFVPEPDSRYILGDGRWLQRPGMRHH
jgi:hypothetical protein